MCLQMLSLPHLLYILRCFLGISLLFTVLFFLCICDGYMCDQNLQIVSVYNDVLQLRLSCV